MHGNVTNGSSVIALKKYAMIKKCKLQYQFAICIFGFRIR